MTLSNQTTVDNAIESVDTLRLRQVRILQVVADGNEPLERAGEPLGRNCLSAELAEIVAAETCIETEHVEGAYLGLRRLREETFDLVLFLHVPGGQDAAEFLRALRGAGIAEPVVIITPTADEALAQQCFALGGDTWASEGSTPAALARLVWRAIQRAELARQAHRLALHRRRWIQRERGETVHHRESQQHILRGLGRRRGQDNGCTVPGSSHSEDSLQREGNQEGDAFKSLPQELEDEYRHLLRSYVMMGAGNLSGDVWQWAQMLIGARVSVRQFFQLHLGSVTQLLDALGNRGSRHCARRADLLLVEALAHLVEYHESSAEPARQKTEQRTMLSEGASHGRSAHQCGAIARGGPPVCRREGVGAVP